METNPIVPRQRNRRADRAAAEEQSFQPMQAPVQAPVQPMASAQAAPPVQLAYAQTPRTMYQQPAVRQPMQAPQAAYPQMGPGYAQQGYRSPAASPAPQARPNQAMAPVQPMAPAQPVQYGARAAAPRPRVLNQSGTVNSGWQQPAVRNEAAAPHARASSGLARDTARAARSVQREAEAQARQEARVRAAQEAKPAKPAKRKLPGWVTTALSLAIILVLALGAAYWLMQAYLTTQENARIAAYEAVLENHHITTASDGTLRVTWQEHIEKYAAQYNLQPAFVTAIIRNESSFRTNAESSVGARGLMQLMPDTAEWIAGKLDDSSYTFDAMYDAETNIRYGCWYLGYLTRLFHGDAVLVSAAYHAGQSTVTQWLSDPEKSADGVTLDLDKLSDGPTKQYIGRVTQTYGIYQSLLYPDEAFDAAADVSAGGDHAAAAER